MIYVTGDMHGDVSRLNAKLKKDDTLIICGDFGFIWTGKRSENTILKKIGNLKFNVAFVDGCHENFDLLEGYPVDEWNGGKVRVISKKLVHLMRGEIYTIEEKTFFTFGGGSSNDYDMRIDANTWYKREQPTSSEIKYGSDKLLEHNNKVDYIITHEPPQTLKNCLNIDTNQQLEINAFFDNIIKTCTFKNWFFGKTHINKRIPPHFYSLFDEMVKIT
ncbi:MAG: metallophosphoesterase [Oscillospiraceae bacterium]|jgi:hypothetical protein|nr:metallophosphoesterase [Oscillospiraceae bacterium]